MKHRAFAVLLLAALPGFGAPADDWSTSGGDGARSNSTPQDLAAPLALRWTTRAAHPPMPAWPASDRQPFDRAFHPVIAGGILAFGSSADGKVSAFDAATGTERWSIFTGGPVRFAPAAWKDRLFVASDDGHLYSLKAATGEILWKKRGGPDDRMVLGNDRLISAWPARGGPAVAEDVVYFAAGIWPSDGIFLYALEAATGKVLWCNDQSGSIVMPQPHGGANAESGVAAQGPLVVAGDLLLVPTGRAVPAAFRRSDGKFQYFHLQENGSKGGSTALALGSQFFNSGSAFDAATGALAEVVGPGALAAFPGGLVRSTEKELVASAIVAKEKTDRKGERVKYKGLEKLWSLPGIPGGTAVISAGKSIVAAGAGRVAVVDAAAQKVVSTFDVDGIPYALAAAEGRLYVGTDQGQLYCFGTPAADGRPALLKPGSPYGENAAAAAAAKEIVETSGVVDGYCVDLACGDGALSYELARRTQLRIFAVDADPENVAAARRKLDQVGLYGVRVTVHLADPALCPYPRYIANLVVSGTGAAPADAVARLQRPYGGVAMIGKQKTVRGPLAGAGSWTHAYADPANTSCSSDTLVKGPLTMHWFRDSDFEMPQRHGRGPAPLYLDGRLIVEGLNGLRAVDAYNGRTLWEVPLPKVLRAFNSDALMGAAGTGSNLCASSDAIYVHTGKRCLRLDPATGKTLAEFEAPALPDGKPGTWGYMAVEGGILYGTLVNPEHIVKWRYQAGDMTEQFTESVRLVALDAATGKLRWSYDAKTSIRHNAIAIGGGKVHLIDRAIAEGDRLKPEKNPPEQPNGELVTLDAATGRELWRSKEEIFGTLLIAGVRHDTLLMSYQPTAFKLPSEKGGRLAAFSASDGKRLWDKKAAYKTRPLLIGRTIYAQGGAWDLLTGEEQAFDLQRSYGCGQLSASAHLAVYRSATLGYHDLASSQGTTNYGGIRLGCWINAVPAGGLVLVPDATTGCRCSYLNQAWIALQPRD
ncbi:MAG: PQQ-binding-like beta-propeller repeat protein [Planctomycetes bacterium]|nr:PQQ-binding-like beta-propeller repeat protein [Planctomycetota bacterium]